MKDRLKFFEESFHQDMDQYLSTGYLQIAERRGEAESWGIQRCFVEPVVTLFDDVQTRRKRYDYCVQRPAQGKSKSGLAAIEVVVSETRVLILSAKIFSCISED